LFSIPLGKRKAKMKTDSLRRITVENREVKKILPLWIRTSFIDDDSDEIFIPAAVISKNETEIMMCASFDGVPIVIDSGHTYVPVSWAEQNYPGIGMLFDQVRETMKKYGMLT